MCVRACARLCVCVCVCVQSVALNHRAHQGRRRTVGRERNSNGEPERQQCAGQGAIQRTHPAAALGCCSPPFFCKPDQVLQFLPPRSSLPHFLLASDSFAAAAHFDLEMSKKRASDPESRVKQQAAALGTTTRLPCFSPESVE